MFSLKQLLYLATTAVALESRSNNLKHVTVSEVVGKCKQDQFVSCCKDGKDCHTVNIGGL